MLCSKMFIQHIRDSLIGQCSKNIYSLEWKNLSDLYNELPPIVRSEIRAKTDCKKESLTGPAQSLDLAT